MVAVIILKGFKCGTVSLLLTPIKIVTTCCFLASQTTYQSDKDSPSFAELKTQNHFPETFSSFFS